MATITFDGKETLKLADELTIKNVAELRRAGETYIGRYSSLVIDMSGVTRCDSSALSLLISWLRYAKQRNKNLHFVNLPKQLVDIASLSGLNNILNIAN